MRTVLVAGRTGPLTSPSVWGVHYFRTELPDPCSWYRIVQPFDALNGRGWDARRQSSAAPPPDVSLDADIFVLQGGDRPDAARVLTERSKVQRLVYETDDDYFAVPAAQPQAHDKYRRADVRGFIAANMRACDMVTVTTPVLAESVRTHSGHPNVVVVPNCVPDGVLGLARFRRRGRTVIGWTGSGNRAHDFAVIRDAVVSVLRSTRRAEFHFMGTDYRHMLPKDVPARHTHPVACSISWETWFGGYDFDIAVCPLAGIPFNMARSPIKAIEAMALGIPVLAADAPPYRGIVTDGVTGYLCRAGDWAKRLRELACDRQAREEMGANARHAARAHIMSAGVAAWDAAYRSLL